MKKSPVKLLLRTGLMLAIIGAISFAFWFPLRIAEHAHIRRLVKLETHNARTVIADEMRSHLLAQVRLAQVCSLEENLSKKEWESYARLFIAHHPGYLALQFLDVDDRVRLSFNQSQESSALAPLLAAGGSLKTALQESGPKRDVILTPAFALGDGSTGHAAVAPIYDGDRLSEIMIAVFDDQKVLEDILASQADQGYGISVVEGNREVYRIVDANSENQQWQEDDELRLPGPTWNVRVWPKANLLGTLQSKLPQLALATGSLIGLLLVVGFDFAQTRHVKARELRRTGDQLAMRVQERTTEVNTLREKFEAVVGVLKRSQEDLSGKLLQLRDEEQRRIARELHDGTTQLLAALAIDLEKLREVVARGDNLKAQKLLAQSCELTEQATSELRTITYLLHPPILDDLGLKGVLPWYVAGFSSRSGIRVDLDLQPDLGRLPQEVELTLFRILQEALTNIHRHSGSSAAEIAVTQAESQVTLQITDYGCGIPTEIVESGLNQQAFLGIGIAGMRERVRQLEGCLDIESTDRGTSIKVTLPIKTSRSPTLKAIAATP